MSWNYRVVMIQHKGEEYYSVYEVYYDKDDNIKMWSKDPMYIGGYTLKELKKDYELYGQAFNKPTLYFKEGKLYEKAF